MTSAFRRFAGANLSVVPPRGISASGDGSFSLDPDEYESLISDIQRFRGRTYVRDGAMPASACDEQGRDRTEFDYFSWHFVLRNHQDEVAGCGRMRFHGIHVSTSELRIYACLTRIPSHAAPRYVEAVQRVRREAFENGLLFGEFGGWAVSDDLRGSAASIMLPVAGWAQCQLLGNALILGAATARHQSAQILRRLGGFGVRHDGFELGPYFDNYFDCPMEILAFDSRTPAAKYVDLVKETKDHLRAIATLGPAS